MSGKDIVSMEYEAQVMIDAETYLKIFKENVRGPFPYDLMTNSNSYFDTPNLDIIDNHMALRIREVKNSHFELTLKIRVKDGVEEINYPLKEDYKIYNPLDLKSNYPKIYEALAERKIDVEKVKYITTLVTDRMEVNKGKYLLVVDKNRYSAMIDYNIEVESDSQANADLYLSLEIEKYHIENKKNYVSKSRRAIQLSLKK